MTIWHDMLAIELRSRATSVMGLMIVMSCSLGCMDGPLHALKRANPYFQKQWAADRALGPTYNDRLEELKLLDAQIVRMNADDQNRWAVTLRKLMEKESSAEMRAQIALSISNIKSPDTQQTLAMASTDEVEKVRLAACKAWKKQEPEVASDGLLQLARKDESVHVRQAAIEALANFDGPNTRAALGEFLDDRSPAVQFQAASSLQRMTGRNYGGDFQSWKRFLDGEDVSEPTGPSLTARIMESIPGLR